MSFDELQAAIKASPATLRRDLAVVEKQGDLIRVHGGVLDPAYARSEISFDERLLQNGAAKRSIAAAAAALIPSGALVFIDAGSTCLEAGKALLSRKDVLIITNSVALVQAAINGAPEVIAIGGTLRKVSGSLTGAGALGALDLLRADWALIGTSGLHPVDGCTATALSEAEIKKAVLARAQNRVLLADNSKWKQNSTVKFAGWDQFDTWITDKLPPSRELAEVRNRKVKIVSTEGAPKPKKNERKK